MGGVVTLSKAEEQEKLLWESSNWKGSPSESCVLECDTEPLTAPDCHSHTASSVFECMCGGNMYM